MNADLMQGKASYEWVTRQIASYTAELGPAMKRMILDVVLRIL